MKRLEASGFWARLKIEILYISLLTNEYKKNSRLNSKNIKLESKPREEIINVLYANKIIT